MLKKYWILIVIISFAAFLRLWKLDQVPVSMFGDELDVGYHAYSLATTGRDYSGNFFPLHLRSLAEWRTPLYIFSSIPTVLAFGISPLGVRLPAAIFGILGVWATYLFASKVSENKKIGLLSAFVLAISPWHIQYSRAAFEVTQMVFFMVIGLYLFIRSMESKGRFLWVSILCLLLMPWIYSTAKLFVPLLLIFLGALYRKELIKLPRSNLVYTVVVGLVLGLPLIYNVITGEGSQRFSYIGVFDQQAAETKIGETRMMLSRMRGETTEGLNPTLTDRFFHNKFTFWGDDILTNYLESLSTEFLFTNGDVNPRHTIEGMGVLYRVEAIALVIGVIMFFSSKLAFNNKTLVGFIVLGGALPSALTVDGGMHATRLILMLPGLALLISFGMHFLMNQKNKILFLLYIVLLCVCYIFYQHNYWTLNRWGSQQWWHAGWQEAVQSIKSLEGQYDRVFISTKDEPPFIFFAAGYEYPSISWQNRSPLDNKVTLEDFGEISYIDKFYFGDPEGGLYEWGQSLSDSDLYLVSSNQVKIDLIREPERTPQDLDLVKTISYPSGDPAFYIFRGNNAK